MVLIQRITEGPTDSPFKRYAFDYKFTQHFTYSPSAESSNLLILKPSHSSDKFRALKFEVRKYLSNCYNVHMIRGYAPGFSFRVQREGSSYIIERTSAEKVDDPYTYIVTHSDLNGYSFVKVRYHQVMEEAEIVAPAMPWDITNFHPFDIGVFLREMEMEKEWDNLPDEQFNEFAGLGRRLPLALRARTGEGMEDNPNSRIIRHRQMIRFGMESPTESTRRIGRLRHERGVEYDDGMDIGRLILGRSGEQDRDGVVGLLQKV